MYMGVSPCGERGRGMTYINILSEFNDRQPVKLPLRPKYLLKTVYGREYAKENPVDSRDDGKVDDTMRSGYAQLPQVQTFKLFNTNADLPASITDWPFGLLPCSEKPEDMQLLLSDTPQTVPWKKQTVVLANRPIPRTAQVFYTEAQSSDRLALVGVVALEIFRSIRTEPEVFGDASSGPDTRPQLSEEEVVAHALEYVSLSTSLSSPPLTPSITTNDNELDSKQSFSSCSGRRNFINVQYIPKSPPPYQIVRPLLPEESEGAKMKPGSRVGMLVDTVKQTVSFTYRKGIYNTQKLEFDNQKYELVPFFVIRENTTVNVQFGNGDLPHDGFEFDIGEYMEQGEFDVTPDTAEDEEQAVSLEDFDEDAVAVSVSVKEDAAKSAEAAKNATEKTATELAMEKKMRNYICEYARFYGYNLDYKCSDYKYVSSRYDRLSLSTRDEGYSLAAPNTSMKLRREVHKALSQGNYDTVNSIFHTTRMPREVLFELELLLFVTAAREARSPVQLQVVYAKGRQILADNKVDTYQKQRMCNASSLLVQPDAAITDDLSIEYLRGCVLDKFCAALQTKENIPIPYIYQALASVNVITEGSSSPIQSAALQRLKEALN